MSDTTLPVKPLKYIHSDNKRVPQYEFPFRHCVPLQIRFSDIDQFGHVNNSVYASMVDIGKIEYFMSVMRSLELGNLNIVVASVHFSFIEPTHMTDSIEVWTTTVGIGTHSFHLQQRIVDRTTGHVKCVAESVMCAISCDGVSAPLPTEWVTALEQWEERPIERYNNK